MITQDDVIYFLLTDRFCNGDPANDQPCEANNPAHYHGGDFAGLKSKIPYLKALGATAIWITPVYLSIGANDGGAGYHGYWAMDFEKVDPHLYSLQPNRAAGSRKYLKELVDALHAQKLKVILDMVVNHAGYLTQTHRDYDGRLPDEWFNRGGGGDVKGELAGLPDLNHDLPDVVDYFVNNVLDWVEETGIDAIRMDTVKHVERKFWYYFKSCVKTRRPDITLIGEVLDWSADSVGRYQREHDFDTLFDFPLCGALKGALIWGQPMTTLARPRLHDGEPRGALDYETPYTNANRLVTLLDNHDLDRRIMTEILDCVGHWDRDLARKILKLCLTFLFTTRGVPQIYYGTEIGMEGRKDPDNRRDMPWDVFGADHRPKADAHAFERDIHDHVVKLTTLRANHPAIRCGYLLTLYADHFLYAYLRESRGDVVLVVINNGCDAMPGPALLDIGGNANIPQRIKSLLEGQTLTNCTDGAPGLTVQAGKAHVKLSGKTAGVFVL